MTRNLHLLRKQLNGEVTHGSLYIGIFGHGSCCGEGAAGDAKATRDEHFFARHILSSVRA